MKMKPYHAPNSGISAYAEGKDYIIIKFKTGERYRYDAKHPGPKHVEEMKSRAHRTSGLTTYINQHVRENYAAKLDDDRVPAASCHAPPSRHAAPSRRKPCKNSPRRR